MILPLFSLTLFLAGIARESESRPPHEIDAMERELEFLRGELEGGRLEVDQLEQELFLAVRDIKPGPSTDKKILLRAGLSAFLYLYTKKSLQYLGRRGAHWGAFWALAIKRFGLRGGTAAVIAASDGPVPVMDLISAGIAIWTLIDLIRLWDDLWEEATGESYYGPVIATAL